jgi:hypothetical protein
VPARLIGAVAALAVAIGPALAEPCTGGAEQTVFGQWRTVPSADSRLDAAKRKVTLATPATTRYLRVLIEVELAGAPGWTLAIRDIDQHVLQILGAPDINAEGEILTRRLATNILQFELSGHEASLPKLLLRQQIVMPFAVEGQPYYSRKSPGVDDWDPLYDMDVENTQRKWGDNVAFMMIGLNEGSQPATCSGIALPPDLLLTNWHCGPRMNAAGDDILGAFWSPSICARTLVDLSWDNDELSREFTCHDVLAKSQDLDYALLRIRPIDGSPAIGAVAIDTSRRAFTASLIHHPAASQKVISEGCRILDRALPSAVERMPATGFSHDCDSEHGSSGAPVFDNQGALIGLHHLGFEKIPETGKCDNRNKAIWIDAILGDLKRKQSIAEDDVTQADIEAIQALVLP